MESNFGFRILDFGFAVALASLAAVALPGCAAAGRWAATHEREYRAEYREGGGAVSMTVRPWNPDLPRDWKGVVR